PAARPRRRGCAWTSGRDSTTNSDFVHNGARDRTGSSTKVMPRNLENEMTNDNQAAAKVFLDLLARSPAWIAAGRAADRKAAFAAPGAVVTWHRLSREVP